MFFLIYFFFLHWIGDFVFQTRWMAENKSNCFNALTSHVFVYTSVLTLGVFLTGQFDILLAPIFFLVNFAAHFVTDKISSQLTKRFWKAGETRKFFSTIGFDQFVHAATLILVSKAVLGVS